jgi:hypothetical protein
MVTFRKKSYNAIERRVFSERRRFSDCLLSLSEGFRKTFYLPITLNLTILRMKIFSTLVYFGNNSCTVHWKLLPMCSREISFNKNTSDFCACWQTAIKELELLLHYTSLLECDASLLLDMSLARGLDYYTGACLLAFPLLLVTLSMACFLFTTLLFYFTSCCLFVCLSVSVCYKSYNRYLTHFYLSNRSEILHTCVKLETMHESIDIINNFIN